MATQTKTAITAEERKTVLDGLKMLHTSFERAAKAAKSAAIASAINTEAAKVQQLALKIQNGELDL